MRVSRHFIRVGEREVHFRRAGVGPPLVAFHVSPQSSAFVMPQLLPLAEQRTVIALDTPGYGESDPLGLPAPTMTDYADAALEVLDALGISRVPVFGAHTGANIAVELARRAPDRVAGVVLDGLSLNSPEVARDRATRYAPDFTPLAGGGHLAWAWQHTRDQLLFWPWYRPHRPSRLKADMKDADFIHDVVIAKMAAADYRLGYRAAFTHDCRDALYAVDVPVRFVTPDADVHTAVERGLSGLPANIGFIDTTHEDQIDAIGRALPEMAGDPAAAAPPRPAPRRRLYRDYVAVGGGQRLVRRGGAAGGRPLVMLHGALNTSAALAATAAGLGHRRPVLALDIAGSGASDGLADGASLADFAEDARAVIAACGIDAFDLYGESIGATLALEIARQAGGGVGRLVLDRPELPPAAQRAELVARIAPPIAARPDGAHLLTAWNMLRDAALFWPWYRTTADAVRDIEPEIDPAVLQARLLAWLKGRGTYGAYARAAYGADPAPLIASVQQPCLVIATSGDLIEGHARAAARGLAAARLALAERLAPPLSVIDGFLSAPAPMARAADRSGGRPHQGSGWPS